MEQALKISNLKWAKKKKKKKNMKYSQPSL